MVLKHLPTPNQLMFVLQTTKNSEKRVVEIQQTKLNLHYKQIKTSDWKPWQEGCKSNAANYSLWVENHIFRNVFFTKQWYPGFYITLHYTVEIFYLYKTENKNKMLLCSQNNIFLFKRPNNDPCKGMMTITYSKYSL